ncbi:ATP-binding cassette domain-containing protein [uncultured Schumannella sp.]|uniref:ATP-binding cassette domain-containing protein n=1 Tax=uncultured Schumannella sp. TaxID=1195956 RepID=UPI0025CC95F5|nr:dipeptide/oligopeptide/nickel ABC transporter ATP-binding protein [uncultured Schumannella sp.]
MSHSAVTVRADDLTLGYGVREVAVDGVNFELFAGEILGIVGEAGSGKSTLARAVAAQTVGGESAPPRIFGGGLSVLGVPLRDASARRISQLAWRVGYLPQDGGSSLEPRMTIGENVASPLFEQDRHTDPEQAGRRAAALIDAVRLPLSVMEKFPHELSRGQRQRIALARALVVAPEVLVADDPTMGVDVLMRGRILDVIKEMQSEHGFSAIVVGHDLRELRTITDRIAVMHAGHFVGYGAVDEVLANPLHPYVRTLATLQR